MTNGATGTISIPSQSGRPAHRLEVFGSTGALMLEGDRLHRASSGEGEWQAVEVTRMNWPRE